MEYNSRRAGEIRPDCRSDGEDIAPERLGRSGKAAAVMKLTEDVEIPTLQALALARRNPMLAEIAYQDPQTIGTPAIDLQSYVQIYKRTFELGKK